ASKREGKRAAAEKSVMRKNKITLTALFHVGNGDPSARVNQLSAGQSGACVIERIKWCVVSPPAGAAIARDLLNCNNRLGNKLEATPQVAVSRNGHLEFYLWKIFLLTSGQNSWNA